MDTRNLRSHLLSLLQAAITILFLIVVQSHHFQDRPYRQDEAWVVHFAMANIEDVGFIPHLLQPLLHLYPENFLQDIWIHLFGHVENITRYFSSLTTVLTLALFYRLSTDLFDRRTGWLALLLLGTYGIYAYYSHEARPYALLVFGAVSFPLALLRFIRKPDLTRGMCALLTATAPAYTHPFMAFVIAGQLLCVFVFVRWNPSLYRRGASLFSALAILVGYRAYINYVDRDGVIAYSVAADQEGWLALYDYFHSNPESLGLLLLLGGVATILLRLGSAWRGANSMDDRAATPAQRRLDSRMRFPHIWRESWISLSLMAMLAIPLAVNTSVPSLTPRNWLIIAPSLALISAIALRQMPRQLQLLSLLFFCLAYLTQFHTYPFYNGNAGYPELAAYLDERYDKERDRLVVSAAAIWEVIPINYYLQERARLGLTPRDIFYVSWNNPTDDPVAPPRFDADLTVSGYAPNDWDTLRGYLGERDRLWLVTGNPYPGGQKMLDAIEAAYTLYDFVGFPGETYYRSLEIREYRRQPPLEGPLWRFGADIGLHAWRLNGEHQVKPCARLSVDTWWSSEVALDVLYSTTLVIAGPDGNGVASADDMPGGMFLTSMWQPDRFYFDERVLDIPCDIDDGDYPLLLGMYAIAQAGRAQEILQIHTSAGEPTGREYEYLTTLLVRR